VTAFYQLDAVPSLVDERAPQATLTGPPDDTPTGLYAALRGAYAARLSRYQIELANALKKAAAETADPQSMQSMFPEVTLELDGQKLAVAVDDDLYTTLFDLYLFYGPAGVAEMAAALQRAAATKRPDVTLGPARRFYTFTRNMLSLVIRETLVQIEALAAERLFDKLGEASRKISAALLGDLQSDLVKGQWWRTIRPGQVEEAHERYRLRHRKRADLLFSKLGDAIGARDRLTEVVRTGSDVQKVAVAAAAFSGAQQQVRDVSPFALIILPGLVGPVTEQTLQGPSTLGLTQQTVEDTLIRTLIGLAQQLDEMADVTTPTRSRIRADLPGLPADRDDADVDVNVATIETLYLDGPRGLQLSLIEKARSRIDDDPGYAAMLHTGTLHDLLTTRTIAPGTFEHCVLHHWLTALKDEIAERRQRRASQQKALSIAAASLSLLAFAAPPLAPAALIVDLSLLAFTVYSVVEQLTALEEAIQLQLPDLGASDAATLAAVGEAILELNAYRQTLPLEVASQLVLLPLARIRTFARLIQGWGYYNDVKTLYEASIGG
jgi:hypothetical protein